METKNITVTGTGHSAAYALEMRFLSPTVQLRTTGGVRLRAFGGIAPTTFPPGPPLS